MHLASQFIKLEHENSSLQEKSNWLSEHLQTAQNRLERNYTKERGYVRRIAELEDLCVSVDNANLRLRDSEKGLRRKCCRLEEELARDKEEKVREVEFLKMRLKYYEDRNA